MAAKSVVEIDVQDEKFQAFWKNSMNTRRRSKNFRSNGEARRRIGDSAKQTEKVLGSTEAIAQAFNEGSPPSRRLTRGSTA